MQTKKDGELKSDSSDRFSANNEYENKENSQSKYENFDIYVEEENDNRLEMMR